MCIANRWLHLIQSIEIPAGTEGAGRQKDFKYGRISTNSTKCDKGHQTLLPARDTEIRAGVGRVWERDYKKTLALKWRSIIGGMLSDSPILSAPAVAVEAIHGVMPPVLFQGFSLVSILTS